MTTTSKILTKDEFPKELLRLKKQPSSLFYVGNKSLLNLPKVAIVGSRRASVYTKNCVLELAKTLKNAGVCVVSGGALGVDISAHKGAMPLTIGVFGTGLDILYPYSNAKTIAEIYENGLALSEYELGSPPLPYKFLERNRIVVSLCKAAVIAQADERSGSMQSARLALELGVPLFVLPQRYKESSGTNRLLSESKAEIIVDFNEFAMRFGELNEIENTDDEIIKFCENGVDLNEALSKFKDKIYEYELEGKLEISNLRVKSLKF